MSRNEQVRVATQKKWAAMAERAKKISEKHTRTCAYFVVRCGMILMESLTWVCRACFCPKQTWLHYVHEFWFILTEHQWINATHGCVCVCALHVCAHCILKRWQKKKWWDRTCSVTRTSRLTYDVSSLLSFSSTSTSTSKYSSHDEYASTAAINVLLYLVLHFAHPFCWRISLWELSSLGTNSNVSLDIEVTKQQLSSRSSNLAIANTQWCWMLMFIRSFFIYKVPSVIIASVSLSPTNRLWHQFSHSIYVEALI